MTRIFVLYAFSGFISLGYQVAWFRILTDWFGSTNLTFTVVVCSFIGGLGLGSLLSKFIGDTLAGIFRLDDPLRLYGLFEILIASAALLTPLAELIPDDTWGTFPYFLKDGIWFQSIPYQVSQVLVAVVCVFIPCVFMGATFPLLCHIFAKSVQGERFPSSLYAWNTLGACSGVLVCQFILILWLGHMPMFWLMAGLNFLLGLYFLTTGGGVIPKASESAAPTGITGSEAFEQERTSNYQSLLVFALIGGFLAGGLEGDLFKRLSFIVVLNPGALMSFISFWVITAIFLGSTLVRWRPRLSLLTIKLAFSLAVLYYGFVWWSGDIIMQMMGSPALRGVDQIWPESMLKLFSFTGLYVFPPYFMISFLLPFVCNRIQSQGKHLGLAYGLNTVAFCVGMIIFTQITPRVNIFYSLKLFMLTMALVAAILLITSEFRRLSATRIIVAALAFGLAAIVTPADFDRSYFIPGHDPQSKPIHSLMSNGANTTFVVDMMDEGGNKRLYFGRITMSGTGFFADSYMRLMAHFPLLAQPQPEKALLICFGVGNTASAIAAHNTIQKIDVVDLNHNVFKTAGQFSATHSNVHLDPRVRLINDDGRNYLNITDETYDLVTSEPPPPMAAGVYRLYSREYYESVLAHLNREGMMTQWFPFEQMPRAAEELVVRTFIRVFPHTLLIRGIGTNLILVGSPSPIDLGRIGKRFNETIPVTQDLLRIAVDSSADLVGKIVLTDSEMRQRYAEGRVISDQHNDLEHLFMDEREQLEKRYRRDL
jgi:spermidine synthase